MRQVPIKQNTQLLPIFLITFLVTIGFTISFPVLTFLCFDQHSSLFSPDTGQQIRSFWYGLSSSLPQWAALFAIPILSIISDYWGRKKLILFACLGIFVSSLCIVVSIWFGALSLFIIGLMIIGFATRIDPIAVATVGDISNQQNLLKNMAYLQCSISLGAFLGPLCGGILGHLSIPIFKFSLPYFVGILLGISASLATIFYYRQQPSTRKLKFNSLFSDLHYLFINKDIRKISAILILSQITWRTYYQFIPPLLKVNLHYNVAIIGYFLALIAIWLSLATSVGIKWLSQFLSIDKLLHYCLWSVFIGTLMAIVGSFMVNHILANLLFWVSSLPVAAGDVIIFSIIITMYIKIVDKEHKGKIMGLCYFIVSVIWAITGFLGGIVAGFNMRLPLCLAILGVTYLLFRKRMVE